MARLELARLTPHAPQACVSTDSTTSAWLTHYISSFEKLRLPDNFVEIPRRERHPRFPKDATKGDNPPYPTEYGYSNAVLWTLPKS